MDLLITTDDNDFVIYNLESNEITLSKGKTDSLICKNLEGQGRSPFRPFGIAIDDVIYIASNDRLGKFDKTTYEFTELVHVPLFINTHQILKDGNILYTTNTSTDTIGIYDLETKENKFLDMKTLKFVDKVVTPKHASEFDTTHVNSLYDAGDKVWFCLHNHGSDKSKFGWIDKKTLETKFIFKAGSCCHNILIIDNKLYTLSTLGRKLLIVDLDTLAYHEYPIENGTKMFLRGMEVYDNKLIIGGSINLKFEREGQKGCLIMMDLDTKKYIINQLDTVKAINDLKIV